MMQKKSGGAIVLTICMALLFMIIPSVSAIGISPASTNINFKSGAEQQFTIRVINRDETPARVLMYAQGKFEQNIELSPKILDFGIGETEKQVFVRIKLPSTLQTPGIHESEIVALVLPPNYELKDSPTVTATAAVISKIKVFVPYPEKYAEAEVFVQEQNNGQSIEFTVSLKNLGVEDISKIKAKINIISPSGKKIAELETNEIGLQSGNSGKVTAIWSPNVPPGPYLAKIDYTYDGRVKSIEKPFTVGRLVLNAKSVKTGSFRIGEIAKFEINLQSQWNEELNGVYADMMLYDTKGALIYSTKTATVDIAPLGNSTILAYVDTKNINTGQYNVTLLMHYGGRTTETKFVININIDNIKTYGLVDTTAQAISSNAAEKKQTFAGQRLNIILLVAVVVLIVFNIALRYYSKSRQRNAKASTKDLPPKSHKMNIARK